MSVLQEKIGNPQPVPASQLASDNAELKALLHSTLDKVNKWESEFKQSQFYEQPHDEEDEDWGQEGDPESHLTTMDGKKAPRCNCLQPNTLLFLIQIYIKQLFTFESNKKQCHVPNGPRYH